MMSDVTLDYETIHDQIVPVLPMVGAATRKSVYVAVDAANLCYSRRSGQRINYNALLDYANGLGDCIQSALYV